MFWHRITDMAVSAVVMALGLMIAAPYFMVLLSPFIGDR